VTLAGQVGVAGHLAIGDGAMAGAQSGIAGNIEAKTSVFGSPAIPMGDAKRSMYVFQKLPDWVRRIKDLEREVRDLREKLNGQDEQPVRAAGAGPRTP
jgi:UDP-3-O-[3-hydroxymyristoyl] glucosamine N-acyltransferase